MIATYLRELASFMRRKIWLLSLPPVVVAAIWISLLQCEADELERAEPARTSFVDELRAGRGAVLNLERQSLFDGRDALVVHPNGLADPAAEVRVPITPRADSCFSSVLRLESTESDGVIFRVEVLNGGRPSPLARQHLTRDRTEVAVQLPLGRWAGQRITLALATEPVSSRDYDWAVFAHPTVDVCTTNEDR